MRLSHLLGRTLRDQTAGAESASHDLLLRAGYVRQHTSGIYSYLHLGLRSPPVIQQCRRRRPPGRHRS